MKFLSDNFDLYRNSIIELDRELFPTPWKEEQWTDFFDDDSSPYFLLLLINEKELLGFALFLVIECEELAHLLKIVVKTGNRSKGLGEQLLSESLSILEKRGIPAAFLEVEHNNIAAKNLYEKFGFCQMQTLKNFYGAGRHALTMRRN